MSLFCQPLVLLPQRPLFGPSYSPLISTLTPIFNSKRGTKATLHLRQSDTFFSLFGFCAGTNGGNHDGNFVFASSQPFIILWTNSSRVFGEGMKDTGENGATTAVFYLTFKDHEIQTAAELHSLGGLGFLSGRLNSRRGPVIECVWLSLVSPCPGGELQRGGGDVFRWRWWGSVRGMICRP